MRWQPDKLSPVGHNRPLPDLDRQRQPLNIPFGRTNQSMAHPIFRAQTREETMTKSSTRKIDTGAHGHEIGTLVVAWRLLTRFALTRFTLLVLCLGVAAAWQLPLSCFALTEPAAIAYGSVALPNGTPNNGVMNTAAAACPFCSAVAPTFSEQISTSDVVVLATLLNQPQQEILNSSDELPQGQFKVTHILGGEKYIGIDQEFETILVGRYEVGTTFMVVGVDAPNIAWSTPVKMSERAQDYIRKVVELPVEGPERLIFFQDFLQDEESILAYDAYDEFARAPYADMIAMKDEMPHDKIVGWIKDIDVATNRKRLYYVMLGICGTDEDTKLLEDILQSGDAERQKGLDALVACYLNLKGPGGMDLIDKVFLSDRDKDYVEVFSVVSALRFHGSEEDVIPRDRLLASLRLVLERPDLADMIIPDLARWEDWSVKDRLLDIFKKPTSETSEFIRLPIASYMLACPDEAAKKYLEEMRQIDSVAVSRAEKILQWEMGLDDDWDDEEDADESSEANADSTSDNKDDGTKATKAKAVRNRMVDRASILSRKSSPPVTTSLN